MMKKVKIRLENISKKKYLNLKSKNDEMSAKYEKEKKQTTM